jgi:hypothetical protein
MPFQVIGGDLLAIATDFCVVVWGGDAKGQGNLIFVDFWLDTVGRR